MKNDWFAYLLQCGDGSIYAGVARDVARRLKDHEGPKGSRYVRAHGGPSRLLWSSGPMARSDALRLEIRLKAMPRERKIALVEGRAAIAA